MSRYIHIGSRVTGWHAVKSRVEQLQLEMTDAQIKDVTGKIKQLADVKTQSMEDVDAVLRIYHRGIQSGELELGQHQVLHELLAQHAPETIETPSGKKGRVNGSSANGINGHANGKQY